MFLKPQEMNDISNRIGNQLVSKLNQFKGLNWSAAKHNFEQDHFFEATN